VSDTRPISTNWPPAVEDPAESFIYFEAFVRWTMSSLLLLKPDAMLSIHSLRPLVDKLMFSGDPMPEAVYLSPDFRIPSHSCWRRRWSSTRT
jgi:hypothetical protein